MTIRKDQAIQNLVDQIPSHTLLSVADLVQPAGGEIMEHAQGVAEGVRLATLAVRKSSALTAASIFVAVHGVDFQQDDRIYFVGKKAEIVAKLRKLI